MILYHSKFNATEMANTSLMEDIFHTEKGAKDAVY